MFNYFGFTRYKPYVCSERRTKLCNISKLLTDELRLLDIHFKERSTNCYIFVYNFVLSLSSYIVSVITVVNTIVK